MPITDSELIRLVGSESQELLAYLRTLGSEQWAAQSACSQWQVADVVAHLARGAAAYNAWIQRALQGNSDPPPGRSFNTNQEEASRGIAERTKANRVDMGDKVLEGLQAECEKLQTLVGDLPTQALALAAFHPTGVITVRGLVRFRLAEIALHSWDIKWGLEASAGLSSECVWPLVEWLPYWYGICFRSSGPLTHPLSFTFQLTDTLAPGQRLVVYGDRFEVEGTGPSDVTFQCSAETYVLLAMGRLSMERAVEQAQLTVSGPPETAASFQRWFLPY